MEEIDFTSDTFDDIVAKDPRFNARAYALLMDVVHALTKDGAHTTGEDDRARPVRAARLHGADGVGGELHRGHRRDDVQPGGRPPDLARGRRHARGVRRRLRLQGGLPRPIPDVSAGERPPRRRAPFPPCGEVTPPVRGSETPRAGRTPLRGSLRISPERSESAKRMPWQGCSFD